MTAADSSKREEAARRAQLLLDRVMSRMFRLIGQMATARGWRLSLAHVSDLWLKEVSISLDQRGVTRRVAADMLGMSFRNYLRKLQSARNDTTPPAYSIWTSVLQFIRENDSVSRDEVIRAFRTDDELSVRGVLVDLTSTGLIYASGTGSDSRYRAVTAGELGLSGRTEDQGLDEFLWVLIYRRSPCSVTDLGRMTGLANAELSDRLKRLEAQGRVRQEEVDGEPYLIAQEIYIPCGDVEGREAGIIDHFDAVADVIARKIGEEQADPLTGGSTYRFDLWDTHPFEDEVLGLLAEFRKRASDLRFAVESFNRSTAEQIPSYEATLYVGQSTTLSSEEER